MFRRPQSRLPELGQLSGESLSGPELYKVAVDEYRFQAQFNWSRTQYLLAFNVAILTAGTVVAGKPGKSAALIYFLGFVAATMTSAAVKTQHAYYRAARDRMRRVEEKVGIAPSERIDSTATLGGRRRKVSVNQLVYLLLASVGVANIVGAAIVIFDR